MKYENKLILLVILFAANFILWFAIMPKINYLIQRGLASQQLINSARIVEIYRYEGYEKFNLNFDKLENGGNNNFCIENYKYNLCFENTESKVRINKKCINGECR